MDSLNLLNMLQGGDAGPMRPVSGLIPAPLSGLDFGDDTLSGAGTESMTGGVDASGQGGPGMAPGMDLNQLSQMLAAMSGDQAGIGTGGDISQSLTAGSIGQPGGGGFSQGYTAGQTGGAGVPGGSVERSADPFALLQKLLGLGTKAAGAFLGRDAQGTASPVIGGATDPLSTPTAQERSAFQTGVASPTNTPEEAAQNLLGSGLFTGGLGGTTGLDDPTLNFLFTSGLLGGQGGTSNENAIADLLSGGYGKFSLYGDSPDNLLTAPGGGLSLGGDPTLNLGSGGTSGGGMTPQSSLGALMSILSLAQAARSGNVPGAIGGGLGALGSLAPLLTSNPALAQALGGSAGGLGSLLGIGTGIQGLVEGNTAQGAGMLAKGLLGALAASPELAAQLGINLGETATGALQSLNTGGAGALASGGAAAVSAGLGALMSHSGASPVDVQSATRMLTPIVAALGGATGGIGAVIAFVVDTLAEMEQTRKLQSGAFNNPIMGQLYSGATSGVANANAILQQMAEGGGPAGLSTDSLMGALAPLANSLLPYYATGQGGVRALRASDTAGSPGTQSKDEYTRNFQQAKTGFEDIVHELLGRGLTYEQLGSLQGINPGWSSMSLDAAGTPDEYYGTRRGDYAKTAPAWSELLQSSQIAQRTQNVDPNLPNYQAPVAWDEEPRYGSEYFIRPPADAAEDLNVAHYTPWAYAGARDIGGMGAPIDLGAFTPDNAFLAAMGAAGYDPNALTPQEFAKGRGGTPDVASQMGVASMYGGPLWQALARMGGDFSPLIQQHFNPWATWSGLSPDQRLEAMGPAVFGPMSMNRDMGIYGPSWGQIENPRVNEYQGFPGVTRGTYTPRYAPGSRTPSLIDALLGGTPLQ